jgi:hypothetical protein
MVAVEVKSMTKNTCWHELNLIFRSTVDVGV